MRPSREPIHGRVQRAEQKTERAAEEMPERRPHQLGAQRDKSQRYDGRGQENGRNICERRGERDAMEIMREQRRHAELQRRGEHDEFPKSKRDAQR